MGKRFVAVAVLLAAISSAQAGELKVLSGNGAMAAVRELCRQFAQTSGNKVDIMVAVVATRITDVAGVDYIGPIPDELQTRIGFAAGLSSSAREPELGRALIKFLTAPCGGCDAES